MIHTCPTDVIEAPAERVWELISVPRHFPSWTTLHLMDAPDRAVEAGDRIVLSKLRRIQVVFAVIDVRAPTELTIDALLPFGVVNREIIRVTPISDGRCRLTFN
jgi:hypothetical protein